MRCFQMPQAIGDITGAPYFNAVPHRSVLHDVELGRGCVHVHMLSVGEMEPNLIPLVCGYRVRRAATQINLVAVRQQTFVRQIMYARARILAVCFRPVLDQVGQGEFTVGCYSHHF